VAVHLAGVAGQLAQIIPDDDVYRKACRYFSRKKIQYENAYFVIVCYNRSVRDLADLLNWERIYV
jgi:hypothetical protein